MHGLAQGKNGGDLGTAGIGHPVSELLWLEFLVRCIYLSLLTELNLPMIMLPSIRSGSFVILPTDLETARWLERAIARCAGQMS